jgi:hypothetical protein
MNNQILLVTLLNFMPMQIDLLLFMVHKVQVKNQF